MATTTPPDSDTAPEVQARQLIATVQQLIQAGCHYRLDDLATLYAKDLRILIVQPDQQVTHFDYAANMAFFRARKDASAPPLDTTAEFLAAEVQGGTGHVIVSRQLDLGAGPQRIVFSLMLRRTGVGEQWQVFREHATVIGPA